MLLFKSSLVDDKEPFILHKQYHCFWWPDDSKRQGIDNHGIDLVLPDDYGFSTWVNSFPPEQNGHHFPDDIVKCIFMNENLCIMIHLSPKFIPKSPINHIPPLVQVMAWCQSGDKPLSEPMLTQFTDAYICGTRGRWIKNTNV